MIRLLLVALSVLTVSGQSRNEKRDFRNRIWSGGVVPAAAPKGQIKLVSWNIERGQRFDGVAAALVREAPDIVLLQEVDLNAKRSKSIHVPEELGRQLRMPYAFAAEFIELGQGKSSSPAYHGQAVLAAAALAYPSIIRFSEQTDYWRPRWFLPDWAIFQRRIGGRLAMAVKVDLKPNPIMVYNVHLESRESERLRLEQMKEVLAHAEKYASQEITVIAGDLNVSGPDSPVIQAVLAAGFQKAVGGEITTSRGAPLDWIFVRGKVHFADGKIHSDVRASDHYPVTVQLATQ